jgi:hypothetical protein
VASPLTASAALRYWNMARQRHCRRLARNGKPAASLLTPSSSEPRTPAGKARVLDARKWLRERDGLSAGGRRIRTLGPTGTILGHLTPLAYAEVRRPCPGPERSKSGSPKRSSRFRSAAKNRVSSRTWPIASRTCAGDEPRTIRLFGRRHYRLSDIWSRHYDTFARYGASSPGLSG